jgi:hypothetical protein
MRTDSLLEKQYRLEELMPLIREALDGGKPVRFSPYGTSMLPMLRQGIDSVVLSPLPDKLRKYDLPLYQRENGQYVLHRVVGVSDTYTCMGDNQVDPEPGLRHEQMIAVVTSFTRNGRVIPVTSFGYKLYCRFWVGSCPIRRFVRRVKGRLRRIIK